MNSRNTHRNASRTQDNPIDWSSFDEAPAARVKLEESTQLRIMSAIVLVLAIVGFIYGCMRLGAAMASLDTTSIDTFLMGSGLLDALMVVFVSLLSIIPAAFGFQVASNPVSFVAPTVFGVVGIILGIVLQLIDAAALAMASSVENAPGTFPWVLLVIPAFLYLFFVVRLHKAANRTKQSSSRSRRSRKEEMWDEDKIWRQ